MSFKKIFFLALIIRLIIVFLSHQQTNFDLESYKKVGEITLQGKNIYPKIARVHHPYFPFFLYLEALAIYLKKFAIDPIVFIKIINLIFDLGILYLLYLLSKKNLKTIFIYAINPVTILIGGFHGQFDTLPLFFILLTIYFFNTKLFISLLSLSLAILIKTWPVIFLIPFFKRLKNKFYFFILFLFPILSLIIYSLFFKTPIIEIVSVILKYQSLFGIFGIGHFVLIIFNFFHSYPSLFFQRILFLLFFSIFIFYSFFINNKKTISKEFLSSLLFFYTITTHFAIQYLSWIIPFLILIKPKNWSFLIFLISFYLVIIYLSWYLKTDFKLFYSFVGFILWLTFLKTWWIIEKK